MTSISKMEVIAIVAEDLLQKQRQREKGALQAFTTQMNQEEILLIKGKLYDGKAGE